VNDPTRDGESETGMGYTPVGSDIRRSLAYCAVARSAIDESRNHVGHFERCEMSEFIPLNVSALRQFRR